MFIYLPPTSLVAPFNSGISNFFDKEDISVCRDFNCSSNLSRLALENPDNVDISYYCAIDKYQTKEVQTEEIFIEYYELRMP